MAILSPIREGTGINGGRNRNRPGQTFDYTGILGSPRGYKSVFPGVTAARRRWKVWALFPGGLSDDVRRGVALYALEMGYTSMDGLIGRRSERNVNIQDQIATEAKEYFNRFVVTSQLVLKNGGGALELNVATPICYGDLHCAAIQFIKKNVGGSPYKHPLTWFTISYCSLRRH